MTEELDVRAYCRKDLEPDRRRPRGEEAKILPIRLHCSAAVSGEKRNGSQLRPVHLPTNEHLIKADLIR